MSESGKPHKWEKADSRLHADCRIFRVRKSRFRHPVRDLEGNFFVIDAPNWVTVVAITKNRELVTAQQFRFGIEDLSLEVPAGVMHVNEDPTETAVRELREETGYAGIAPELLGWVYPNPAIQNNRCYVVGIQQAQLLARPEWDEHEEIKTRLIPLDQVPAMLAKGDIRHALSMCALQYFFLKHPWQ